MRFRSLVHTVFDRLQAFPGTLCLILTPATAATLPDQGYLHMLAAQFTRALKHNPARSTVTSGMYGRATLVLSKLCYMCRDIIPVGSKLNIYMPLKLDEQKKVEYGLVLIMMICYL